MSEVIVGMLWLLVLRSERGVFMVGNALRCMFIHFVNFQVSL